MGRAYIGVSGWTYAPWRGDFYPKGLTQKNELAYASERLTSIEINGSFYALQKPASYAKWRDQTPDDFVFAVKGSRFISHMKRLGDVEEALATFFGSGVYELGPKLGPVLWQLPETFRFDAERVAAAPIHHRHDVRPSANGPTAASDGLLVRVARSPQHYPARWKNGRALWPR